MSRAKQRSSRAGVLRIGNDNDEDVQLLEGPPATEASLAKKVKRSSSVLLRMNFWIAIIAVVLLVFLTVVSFIYPSTISNYHAGLLVFHGILALQVISAGSDQQGIDFIMSIVFAFFALAFDLASAIVGWISAAGCASVVDNYLCTNEPIWRYVEPTTATLLSVFALVHTVTLFFWFFSHKSYIERMARAWRNIKRRESGREPLAPTEEPTATDIKVVSEAQGEASEEASGGSTIRTLHLVSAVIGLLVIAVTAFINIIYTYEVSFYRAVYLVVPAHLVGCQLALFGRVPGNWKIALFVFSLLSAGTAIYGSVLELPRFFRCILTTYVPTGQIETIVCDDESWRGYVTPWALAIVAILSLVAFVASIVSLFSSPVKKALARRKARRAARRQQAPTEEEPEAEEEE